MLNNIKKLFSAEPDLALPAKLPARNEPCRCGSSQKYKNCCMTKDLRKGLK